MENYVNLIKISSSRRGLSEQRLKAAYNNSRQSQKSQSNNNKPKDQKTRRPRRSPGGGLRRKHKTDNWKVAG